MHVRRVCDAVCAKFLDNHVQGLDEELRPRDQKKIFQRIKSLSIEDIFKIGSQYIRDEEGRMLRDPGSILERWTQLSAALLNVKSEKPKHDINIEIPPVDLDKRSRG